MTTAAPAVEKAVKATVKAMKFAMTAKTSTKTTRLKVPAPEAPKQTTLTRVVVAAIAPTTAAVVEIIPA